MLFNSLEFLVFFPIAISAYFIIPHKLRWILLLLLSYYFYMCWKPEYIILIAISTLIDYFAAIFISKSKKTNIRNLLLALSICTNLGFLFFFKYFNFVGHNVNLLLSQWNVFHKVPLFDILLPVGISFYTFQTMSYTIDVYNRKILPERHLGIFALYVSFFPQLVAGPIERAGRLLPQLRQRVTFEYERIRNGLLLMLWGFFKKMVIADRLADYVNQVYNSAAHPTAAQDLIATYFFAFQIYCDFSGYSDIAIGLALIMGVQLMTNFKRPYFATSIRCFWQRWHISLSTWFRDYIYIPIGGNRVVKWRWYYNIVITFVISGFWHGANWTFIVWGAFHGVAFLMIKDTFARGSFIKKALFNLLTFHVVVVSWIFFRSESLLQAYLKLLNIFTGSYNWDSINLFTYKVDLSVSLISLTFLLIADGLSEKYGPLQILFKMPRLFRWGISIAAISAIILFGKFESLDFIYFQF